MPYASTAQRGKFHAMLARGEISPQTVHEFDVASKGKDLPHYVHTHVHDKDGKHTQHTTKTK